MCAGKVPEGKGMLWKAAVAAIKAQGGTVGSMKLGPEHDIRPHRHRGQARRGRGRRLRRLEVAEVCENREITVIEEAKKMGNGIGIYRQEPHHQPGEVQGRETHAADQARRGHEEGRRVSERGDRRRAAHRVRHRAHPSLGVEQNTKLYDEIAKAFPERKLIGDATTPAGKVYRTLEAVKGGYQASMAL